MEITKDQSLQVKGIAILLMLFLHLFNGEEIAKICHPLIFIGDTPLVTIMTRSCSPVGYFLIISGYGLNYVYDNGSLGYKAQAKRILKLYKTYWTTLFIFVTIGAFINPAK